MTCSPLDLRVGKYQLWFPHPKVSNLWKKGRKFEEVTWQFYRKIFLHDNHPFTGEKLHPAFQELGVVVSAPVRLLCQLLSVCCASSCPPVILAPVRLLCRLPSASCTGSCLHGTKGRVYSSYGPGQSGSTSPGRKPEIWTCGSWFLPSLVFRKKYASNLTSTRCRWPTYFWKQLITDCTSQSRMGTKAPQSTVDISAHVHTRHHIG